MKVETSPQNYARDIFYYTELMAKAIQLRDMLKKSGASTEPAVREAHHVMTEASRKLDVEQYIHFRTVLRNKFPTDEIFLENQWLEYSAKYVSSCPKCGSTEAISRPAEILECGSCGWSSHQRLWSTKVIKPGAVS